MKKLFAVLLATAMIIGGGQAMACYPMCTSSGSLNTSVFAIGGALDMDSMGIPAGRTFGISGAGGIGGASTSGYIGDGDISSEIGITAGGVTSTGSYRLNRGDVEYIVGTGLNKAIGVGTRNDSLAVIGGSVDVSIDPNARVSMWSNKGGYVSGSMGAAAAQGTLAKSKLYESPRFFNSDGRTAGIAAQGSLGGFYGSVWVSSPGNGRRYDNPASASISANITMAGYSQSDSFRFIDIFNGGRTEGMGTVVSTGTEITSSRSVALDSTQWDWYGCRYYRSIATGSLYGGFTAGGIAKTKTVQSDNNGFALAKAKGVYTGSGVLGCDYLGNATGYSMTSITKINGMKGSIVSSSAGMTVTSTTHGVVQ